MFGIIPAAGKGLRFGEISKRYPKPILPYQNKPIIIHNIELMLEIGCNVVYVVVNHGSEKIEELLDFYHIPEVKVVKYETDDGPAGSIAAGVRSFVGDLDEDFLVLLSDVIPDADKLKTYIRENRQKNSFITASKVSDYERWCLAYTGESDYIDRFIDKPKNKPAYPNKKEKKFLAVNGCYYFTSHKTFSESIEKAKRTKTDGEFQISHAIEKYMEDLPVKCWEIPVLDFGTIGEFLQNRNVKICRGFNEISIESDRVVKSSVKKAEKVYREFTYLQNVPYSVAPHFPRVYSSGYDNGFWYSMEVMRMQNLREMYVFYNNDVQIWEIIIEELLGLVKKFSSIEENDSNPIPEIIKKTQERENFEQGFIELMTNHVWSTKKSSFFHGDFCLGNIFYDEASKFIRALDPRGERYGSYLYDLAKLMHSFVGKFDIVDCEMYSTNGNMVFLYNRGKNEISYQFIESLKTKFGEEVYWDVVLLSSSLFSSMIPLHYHNETNQKIFRKIHQIFLQAYLEKKDPIVPDVMELV